jgi:SAM-dependent methyltransferase
MSERCTDVLEHVQRAIQGELRALREEAAGPLSVLDVGCWDGAATATYAGILGGAASGVEVFADQAELARGRNIDVAVLDLETQAFPWQSATFDVVIANQVFEHLKNVWLPMSEIARVLKPGGHLLFSVPNLSSLHNRVMLAFGFQPSSIRTFGPHVRGFTYRQMKQFLTFGDCFRVRRVQGVGFYPASASLGAPLARLWSGASHTPILVAQRQSAAQHDGWLKNARDERAGGQQTHYHGV